MPGSGRNVPASKPQHKVVSPPDRSPSRRATHPGGSGCRSRGCPSSYRSTTVRITPTQHGSDPPARHGSARRCRRMRGGWAGREASPPARPGPPRADRSHRSRLSPAPAPGRARSRAPAGRSSPHPSWKQLRRGPLLCFFLLLLFYFLFLLLIFLLLFFFLIFFLFFSSKLLSAGAQVPPYPSGRAALAAFPGLAPLPPPPLRGRGPAGRGLAARPHSSPPPRPRSPGPEGGGISPSPEQLVLGTPGHDPVHLFQPQDVFFLPALSSWRVSASHTPPSFGGLRQGAPPGICILVLTVR